MFSYCADLVKRHRRDDFLQSLFVPAEARETMLALYALNAELSQVRDKTGEELIGQVRLAWWQEAVSAIYDGHPPREQPVLQALAQVTGHVPQEPLMALIDSYREYFPELPDVEAAMDELALVLLRAISPQSEPGWQKAKSMIAKHRKRYGDGRNGWLNLKLLIAG
ncbi:MAG: squalene/phytoene synthase family protein [Pseudomonadota bacterium]|nr:squalene/phytoene synthase family protein [Pseudomonadota bacterium]